MKLVHTLIDANIDDFVVLHNPSKKYLLREHIYPQESVFQLMHIYYDWISGNYWMPITLDCNPTKSMFMIGLSIHSSEFARWDKKIYLIPFDNTEIYKISTDVSFENSNRIDKWNENREKLWLAWHNTAIHSTLEDYLAEINNR